MINICPSPSGYLFITSEQNPEFAVCFSMQCLFLHDMLFVSLHRVLLLFHFQVLFSDLLSTPLGTYLLH